MMSETLARFGLSDIVTEMISREKRRGLIYKLFPETGDRRRELYPQHMEFFRSGTNVMSRLAMCANGVGKTLSMGGYEFALHATGLYPEWWEGVRYTKPIRAWFAGESMKSTRTNQQKVLLGEPNSEKAGGGLIPTELIDFDTLRRWPGSGGLIDTCHIKHASGGMSMIGARTYQQDFIDWAGENLDLGWMDEPPPILHYQELVTRTRGSEHPCIMLTHTPKKGATEIVVLFTGEQDSSRKVINCTWDDVPHLTAKWKKGALANVPTYMRSTVSKGMPTLGVGAVYPIPESSFVIEPLETIPSHWPRAFGFDGGWHNTAVTWGAFDRDTATWYLYDEHKAGELVIPVHAAAINSRGKWIPGIGDVRLANVTDGEKMIDEYHDAGCPIMGANKPGKEARIEKVRQGLMTGKIKVYSTLRKWLEEYRMFHYDDKGQIKKVNDHLMDSTCHLVDEGPRICMTQQQATMIPKNTGRMNFGQRLK